MSISIGQLMKTFAQVVDMPLVQFDSLVKDILNNIKSGVPSQDQNNAHIVQIFSAMKNDTKKFDLLAQIVNNKPSALDRLGGFEANGAEETDPMTSYDHYFYASTRFAVTSIVEQTIGSRRLVRPTRPCLPPKPVCRVPNIFELTEMKKVPGWVIEEPKSQEYKDLLDTYSIDVASIARYHTSPNVSEEDKNLCKRFSDYFKSYITKYNLDDKVLDHLIGELVSCYYYVMGGRDTNPLPPFCCLLDIKRDKTIHRMCRMLFVTFPLVYLGSLISDIQKLPDAKFAKTVRSYLKKYDRELMDDYLLSYSPNGKEPSFFNEDPKMIPFLNKENQNFDINDGKERSDGIRFVPMCEPAKENLDALATMINQDPMMRPISKQQLTDWLRFDQVEKGPIKCGKWTRKLWMPVKGSQPDMKEYFEIVHQKVYDYDQRM